MEMLVLASFSKDIGVFNPPFVAQLEKDDDLIEGYRRGVVRGKIQEAENLKVFKLGIFDDKTGNIELFPKPVELVDLAQFVIPSVIDPEKAG